MRSELKFVAIALAVYGGSVLAQTAPSKNFTGNQAVPRASIEFKCGSKTIKLDTGTSSGGCSVHYTNGVADGGKCSDSSPSGGGYADAFCDKGGCSTTGGAGSCTVR